MTTKPTHTTLEAELVTVLEDFAEDLASVQEEDSFAKMNEVVTQSVKTATQQLQQLIEKKVIEGRIDELEKANKAGYGRN